jgi:acyl-CoA synthetase (AMP-forming)/AMP-acid ligase II
MPTTATHALSDRITAVLALDPASEAIEFEGRWHTWGELARTVEEMAALVTPGHQVGIVLRNRPAHVGCLLGVLTAGGCVVTVNPRRGVERTREDLAQLGLDDVVGTAADLDELLVGVRSRPIVVGDLGEPLRVGSGASEPVPGRDDDPEVDRAPTRPGVAVRMLTSGTTGPPKRVDLTYDLLARVLLGAKYYQRDQDLTPQLRTGRSIVNSPLVHLGGLFRVLLNVTDGRPSVLLERFTVEGWADAVRRHRPATATLVPAAVRMVLEADLDRDDLSSLRSVICGTAPLSPDDADAFAERYGVPVLISYAATEFGGAVAGWNLADHERWWSTKRGSVGRAHPGSRLRIVSEADGHELGPDEVGLLEVDAAQLHSAPDEDGGPDAGSGDRSGAWVRTTDLARIDDDGFVWILGRADQAIIRGGFKVLPDDVRAALESHPEVRGASVIGAPDARLGEVPVAVVELREADGASAAVTPADLTAFLADRLAPYEIPTVIRIVRELPRTDSGKVDLGEVRALVGGAEPADGTRAEA